MRSCTVAIFEKSQAQRALADYQSSLAAFKASNSTITSYVRMKGKGYANGGVVSAFANGGIQHFANGGEHHMAQIARGGATRVWNEPETGGEAYISLAPAKRARSEQIMAETADHLGGVYIPAGARSFANGAAEAVRNGRQTESQATVLDVDNVKFHPSTVQELTRGIADAVGTRSRHWFAGACDVSTNAGPVNSAGLVRIQA